MPLTEEFRPRKIADFVGLEKPKKVLQNLLRNPRPCALLFVGEPGCGKTTIAQAFADELGAELHHVGSQQCQKETLAEISRMCEYAAFDYKTGEAKAWHVVLVDEADCASDAAQKYLLSKLDSTGRLDRTIWIFTANATDRLEERFISRCLRLDFGSYGAGSGIGARLGGEGAGSAGTKLQADSVRKRARITFQTRNRIARSLKRSQQKSKSEGTKMDKFLVVSYDPNEQQWFYDVVLAADKQAAQTKVTELRDYVIDADVFTMDELDGMNRRVQAETKEQAEAWYKELKAESGRR
jgi:ATPase family associated with various cellular activities (AAA)